MHDESIKAMKFGEDVVYLVREMAIAGSTVDDIYHRYRDIGVTPRLIREWLNGRGYPNAVPSGFESSTKPWKARWTAAERMGQLTNAVVRQARQMVMDGVGVLEIEEFLNADPRIRRRLTGLHCTDWQKSDLFKVLFGSRPGHSASMPTGYRRWVKKDGKRLMRDLIEARRLIDPTGANLCPSMLRLFVDRTPPEIVEPVAERPDEHGLRRVRQCDLRSEDDAPTSSCMERHDDPYRWAGAVVHAYGPAAEARRQIGAEPPAFHVSAHIQEVKTASGCTKRQARRALSYARDKAA